MYLALGIYWIISGWALYIAVPSNTRDNSGVLIELGLCLLLGGVIVPARVVAKMIA